MLKRLLGLKKNVKEAREINEASIARLDTEKEERHELNARLEAMEVELEVISKGAVRGTTRRPKGASNN